MYYEEKIINGVLMCRNNPSGEWKQCSIAKMSSDIIDLKQQLSDLKASLPKVRADAVREAASIVSSGAIEINHRFMIIEQPYCYISKRALHEHADKLEAGNE